MQHTIINIIHLILVLGAMTVTALALFGIYLPLEIVLGTIAVLVSGIVTFAVVDSIRTEFGI